MATLCPTSDSLSPEPLKVLSWNIDGLDERDIIERTTAVIQTILLKRPHCVFLQEVIEITKELLQKKLGSKYTCFFAPASVARANYFPAILVCNGVGMSIEGSLDLLNFPNSCMGRQLLQLSVTYRGVRLRMLTAHLESMKENAIERKAQLRKSFDVLTAVGEDGRVGIFGGDLNIREAEVKSVKVPAKAVDVWIECGADTNYQFTWDVRENDNLNWPYPNKPRSRYDRLYLCPGEGPVRPKRFELVGQDRLHKCGRFPSDHWGMWAEFDIM